MRNRSKINSLEQRLPLLAVEQNLILSKAGDVTMAFRLELPEIFTLPAEGYEEMHATWNKAIKNLPVYTVVHKQDIYLQESYHSGLESDEERSFLSHSYLRHFNERPYLNHSCYLFLTKTTKERMRGQSLFSTLCRRRLVGKEVDPEYVDDFIECVGQFERIINSSDNLRIVRLEEDELLGSPEHFGLLEQYLSLNFNEGNRVTEDVMFGADETRIGDKRLCVHTLSCTEDLPSHVGTDRRYEKFSTDLSACSLSFAAPVGLLLSCNHIYNQYLFLDDSKEILKRFESTAHNMSALSSFSRANGVNEQWLQAYMNVAHTEGHPAIRAHCNVMAWSDNPEELRTIKNDVGAALSRMDCRAVHNTIDAPTLYWAAMPGNAADFPSEESFYTFPNQALCFFAGETNYKDSLSPFGIKLSDRVTGKPVHLDLSDLPMQKGVITNRNKFILGPSGSGKSFFTNHMVRQYYEQGAHVLLVDTGNSYEGLCSLINGKTKGGDGVYFSYSEKAPISFNPFYTRDYQFDVEKRESLCTLIITLWKSQDEKITKTERTEIDSALNAYLSEIAVNRSIRPCFNTFYEYLVDVYREELSTRAIPVDKDDFNIDNLLTTLRPYYRGGRYDFLLNSKEDLDLTDKRFIVFELDNISSSTVLLPVVTLVIMETFISKMRKLKGIRKMILIEECWKALMSANMSEYIKYLFKTVRKYFGEAIVVTQEVDDIISSPIVKDAIINNSDCKILLDQRKYMKKFEGIEKMLGLSEKEKGQILSINMDLDPKRKYKEVWIGLGGTQSAVYATETSKEEYYTYTTEEKEKLLVRQAAAGNGGDYERAVASVVRKD